MTEQAGTRSVPDKAAALPETTQDAESKDRAEVFEQYWRYTTNLRNWFIAYGVGGILLLTRSDAIFNAGPTAANVDPAMKANVLTLFIFGLASQVGLAMINKVAHYYSYQSYVVEPSWRHRVADWVCGCFLIDIAFELHTLCFLCKDMCGRCSVPTNLAIDDRLLNEALRIGGHRTKRETVDEALQEYIQRRKRQSFVKLFGKIDFRPDWDYKKARRRA